MIGRIEKKHTLFPAMGHIKPTQILVLGFIFIILIGSILLTLPVSTVNSGGADFSTALFTATSAVCVTGLVVVDTGTFWSPIGQMIIIILIQIGGLGFMSFATLIFLITKRKIGLKDRLILQEGLNSKSLGGIVRYTKNVVVFTVVVELIGSVILTLGFLDEYGLKKSVFMGLFHSISAFCNAGFDIIGGNRSITPYVDNFVISVTIGLLLIIGGLGFFVISDIYRNRRFKNLSMHSKLVIVLTVALVLGGTVLIFAFEYDNSGTIENQPFLVKILACWFQSITTRTAGYNSLDLKSLRVPTTFLMMMLMLIGGSPGSTAGGIKTTTVGTLLLTVLSVVRGKEHTEVFGRTIPLNVIKKALVIITISISVLMIAILILCITEDGSFIEIAYEAVSAFGTVGLTLGITSSLTSIGRIVVMILMFIGRLGPLTIALAIGELQASKKDKGKHKYPDGNILVG